MAVKHMSGTPWHVETLGTGEGKQRHRSHCRHFDYVGKQCNYGSRCFGSAHCQLYEVMSPNEERKKRAEAKKIAKSNEYKSVATQQPITAIAMQKPYYFVMRDSSMASDSVATNFEQIFATYSPDINQ